MNRSWLLLLLAPALAGQTFTERGFLEFRNFAYPQSAPNDSALYTGDALLRWEGAVKFSSHWQVNGSFDARVDTHRQIARDWRVDVLDQDPARPALSLRRFSAIYNRAGWTIEVGRQFIRWGKADLLNPTDRFAPRDFGNPLQPDYLGVTAARATYEHGGDTLDAVYAPLFTPSRTPLLYERWAVLPEGIPFTDQGSHIPGRGQAGARWNHIGAGYEFSLCYFDGFNNLPLFNLVGDFGLRRSYPRLRLYGGDVAVPLRWFTLKSEAAYFQSPDQHADDYLLYVVQLERISGEWTFVGGYAGEWVNVLRNPLTFAPDRGIAKTFLGRTSYNLDANRTVAVEGAVRQNGAGMYAKAEYSQAIGSHWRATAAFVLLRGQSDDFLGQYRRNSHFLLSLRYSF